MLRREAWVAGAVMAIALPAGAAAEAAPVRISVLSSRADMVSGGDALARIALPKGAKLKRLRVRLGRRNVTEQFERRPNGKVEGLLTGIPNKRIRLTARLRRKGGRPRGARLRITGHPNGGPVISGPQLEPWYCQPKAVDEHCNQPASYQLLAVTRDGFVPYDPSSPPEGIRQTTTSEGQTVPFIVRVETGYQDRDQYRIAVLYEPGKPWEPWAPQAGWNRRLVFTHGGSCGTDRKAGNAPGVLNQELLGKGFLVASTALNNLGHNCNPVIIAESEMMARERIVEQYGPVGATLGTGCSGGAIAQMMTAHAYPGFYDGITVSCTFVDLLTTGKHGAQGHLFQQFFKLATIRGGLVYTPLDQAAVSGSPLASVDDLVFDTAFWGNITGERGCGGMPPEVPRWSPSNPSGERCGVLDHNINVFGTGSTGYVGIPLDNTGLQYGLRALEQGTLSPAKFVDLNANIGGLDKASYADVPQRTEADMSALVNAYRSGYMAIGNTLDQTPILEGRGPNEVTAHVSYPSLVINARLDRMQGTHANHVLWQGPVPVVGQVDFANRMVLAMDRWVAAIKKDKRKIAKAQKIRENKPGDITDHCELLSGVEQPGTDCPAINRFYPSSTQIAGESLRNDVLKCQLKPLRRDDYSVSFTDAEWAMLQQTFPTGVCDFSKPGVGEQPTVPWLTYKRKAGGEPLGPAPKSKPLRRKKTRRKR
jgi:Tannase-like family of unknown function (DUF6351)